MRFKDYGRNCILRKAYVQSPGLLMVGVDIGKAAHSACFGTKTGTVATIMDFAHNRDDPNPNLNSGTNTGGRSAIPPWLPV